jgi:hypothetical protein
MPAMSRLRDRAGGAAIVLGSLALRSCLALPATSAAAQENNEPDVPAAPSTGWTPSRATEFTTPDGSRFVLIPTAGPPVIHWAIATPCGPLEDPAGHAYLAEACVRASLNGPFRISSATSPAAEQAAIEAFEAAATELARASSAGSTPTAAQQQAYADARAAMQAAGNPRAFRRTLMAAPTQDLEVKTTYDTCVIGFSTTESAMARVANLMVERRENSAMRGIETILEDLQRQGQRSWDGDPHAPLRSEVLALAFAGHPLATSGQRPATGILTRARAEATWRRTQRPDRTLHVLTGRFDVEATRQKLEVAFARTGLGSEVLPAMPPPARLGAMRSSTIPGAPYPTVLLAWQLQGDEDPVTLAILARWLGGIDSPLGRELRRLGRKNPGIDCSAPWPLRGPASLLLVVVTDPDNGPGDLAAQVLTICRTAGTQSLAPGEVLAAQAGLEQVWEYDSRKPALLAARLAIEMLRAPEVGRRLRGPLTVDTEALARARAQIFAGQPVVVEWRTR